MLQPLRLREAGYRHPPILPLGPHTVDKLQLEVAYTGHAGCVNRIAWKEDGSRLASASDDRTVMLWSYPDSHRLPIAIETQHTSNIFGVAFIPNTDMVVTGAMDCCVQLHRLDAIPTQQASTHPPAQPTNPMSPRRHHQMRQHQHTLDMTSQRVHVHTTVYECHRSRVKQVEVEAGNPHLFFSVGEDGFVRQYDVRMSTHDQNHFTSHNTLLAMHSTRQMLEAKSLALNKVYPHLLAVAASDAFVRVFDRRMLSPGDLSYGLAQFDTPLFCMAPPHLAIPSIGSTNGHAAYPTYVHWGSTGRCVLANYHADHAYSFDCTHMHAAQASIAYGSGSGGGGDIASTIASGGGVSDSGGDGHAAAAAAEYSASATAHPILQMLASRGTLGAATVAPAAAAAREAMRAGNEAYYRDGAYHRAVLEYERALQHTPGDASLLAAMAMAMLRRDWPGDKPFALRACDTALSIAPHNADAHYQKCNALMQMHQLEAARVAVDQFAMQCQRSTHEVQQLRAEIDERQSQANQAARMSRLDAQYDDEEEVDREFERGEDEDDDDDDDDDDFASEQDRQLWHTIRRALLDTQPRPIPYIPTATHTHTAGTAAGVGRGQGRVEEGNTESRGVGNTTESRAGGTEGHAVESHSGGDTGGRDTGGRDTGGGASVKRSSGGDAQQEEQQGAGNREGGGVLSMWDLASTRRVRGRYMGHCNLHTDIKEAVFLGHDDSLVACGSDDGCVFLYDAVTGAPLLSLDADEDIVNCIQGHPHLPVIATSGIEDVVRLWGPSSISTSARQQDGLLRQVEGNQRRMNASPLALGQASLRRLLLAQPHLLALLLAHADEDDE